MRISVIIPCHNCAPWIQQALLSVKAQTVAAHEIIVVNDGSDDDSVQVIEESGVAVTLLEANFGNAAAARNEGIAATTAEWVAFLDADDVWMPNHLESFESTVQSNDVAYYAHHDATDALSGNVFERKGLPIAKATGGLGQEFLLQSYVTPGATWQTSGMLIRRERILSAGQFDPSLLRRHDAEFFLRMCHTHTWAYNPTPTWRYLAARPGNISSSLVECLLYEYMARKKLAEIYADERLVSCVKRSARSAVGIAIRGGTEGDYRRAIELVSKDLSAFRRLYYRAIAAPVMFSSKFRNG